MKKLFFTMAVFAAIAFGTFISLDGNNSNNQQELNLAALAAVTVAQAEDGGCCHSCPGTNNDSDVCNTCDGHSFLGFCCGCGGSA